MYFNAIDYTKNEVTELDWAKQSKPNPNCVKGDRNFFETLETIESEASRMSPPWEDKFFFVIYYLFS